MLYFQFVECGYIVAIGTGFGGEEITKERYLIIENMIKTGPAAPEGYIYRLRADTLEWELVELPAMPTGDELAAE